MCLMPSTIFSGWALYVVQFNRIKNALRQCLSKIRLEQALLQAYGADGWQGVNREKLRPTAELHRARATIVSNKVAIRNLIKELDEANGDKPIPDTSWHDGEIDEIEIFCAKCLEKESTDDNDILLCDVPPDDEGWLCPACDMKADCIFVLNEEFDTALSGDAPYTEIFCAEARGEYVDEPNGSEEDGGAKPSNSCTLFLDVELPSDDEEDENFDPSSGVEAEEETEESDEGEDSGADADSEGDLVGEEEGEDEGAPEILPELDPEALVQDTKRRRPRVDYRKLNEELFGAPEGASAESEDDEFTLRKRKVKEEGAGGAQKARKRKWACSACTFLNRNMYLACQMCHTDKKASRPPKSAKGDEWNSSLRDRWHDELCDRWRDELRNRWRDELGESRYTELAAQMRRGRRCVAAVGE
eukprot:gene4202-5179_t